MIGVAYYRMPDNLIRIYEDHDEERAAAENNPGHGLYRYSDAFRHLRPGHRMPDSRKVIREPVDPRVVV